MAETTETREEREARWWRGWFEADYSWEGLAKKEIAGGGQFGEKTLQDYWRRDPVSGKARTDAALRKSGELVLLDGRWWHLAHLPPRGLDGVESWKADPNGPKWERLNESVEARIAAAIATPGKFGSSLEGLAWVPEGSDGRARLDGAVLMDLRSPTLVGDDASSLALSYQQGAFLADQDFNEAVFANGADFHGATFSGVAWFDSATFSGDASFEGVTFSGYAWFENAAFSRNAHFKSVIFSDGCSLEGATFSGDASFNSAAFSDYAWFESVTFSGNASFESMTVAGNAWFESATFSGDPSFKSASFSGDANFEGATFSGDPRFESVVISGGAWFDKAIFAGDPSFEGVTISGSAWFDNATFSGAPSFKRAIFSSNAWFESTTFSGAVSFENATISGYAWFENATFSGVVNFYGAAFGKDFTVSGTITEHAYVSFVRAVFKGVARFAVMIEAPAKSFHRTFYLTQFLAPVEFVGVVAPGQAGRLAGAFVETIFKDKVILDDGAERNARQYFQRHMLPEAMGLDDGERNDRLRALEDGCRALKVVMDVGKDELRQQRYYRFQLMARQRRNDTDSWERVFGRLYGWASDYGSSFSRPLVGIGLLVLLFAVVVYWPWMDWLNIKDVDGPGGVFVALNHSLRTLSPFNLLVSAANAHSSPQPTSLFEVNPAVTFGARLVSGLQSILSGVLIFLFGLAVKRRFQIS
jgi:uncharacterized protein YjbI with pentapeptide repeats